MHLVVNHLEMDKRLFLHKYFVFYFSVQTIFKEIGAETNRHPSEQIIVAMPLKNSTEELTVFHGVILNLTRCVKCSFKNFFLE